MAYYDVILFWPTEEQDINYQSASKNKISHHCHVDVAGVELHVDLLVDEGLTLLMVVLSDLGSHDVIENQYDDKIW